MCNGKLLRLMNYHVWTVAFNDNITNTYSFSGSGRTDGKHRGVWTVNAEVDVPDYYPSGVRYVHTISMRDRAGNPRKVYFSHYEGRLATTAVQIDETPVSIDVFTPNPDMELPTLDLDNITIEAEPTRPNDPNGETQVDITFKVRDDLSGYQRASFYLRDPHGETYNFSHSHPEQNRMYFIGGPYRFPNLSNDNPVAYRKHTGHLGACRDACPR